MNEESAKRVLFWRGSAEQKTGIRIFHCLARLWQGGKRSRGYWADFATLNAQTETGREPHWHCRVRTGSIRAPQPRAREKTRGRKRKALYSRTRSILSIVIYGCRKQSLLHGCSSAADVLARGSVASSRNVGSVVAEDGGQEVSRVVRYGGSFHGEWE